MNFPDIDLAKELRRNDEGVRTELHRQQLLAVALRFPMTIDEVATLTSTSSAQFREPPWIDGMTQAEWDAKAMEAAEMRAYVFDRHATWAAEWACEVLTHVRRINKENMSIA